MDLVQDRVFLQPQHDQAEIAVDWKSTAGLGGVLDGRQRSDQVGELQSQSRLGRRRSHAVAAPILILGERTFDNAIEIKIRPRLIGQGVAGRKRGNDRRGESKGELAD